MQCRSPTSPTWARGSRNIPASNGLEVGTLKTQRTTVLQWNPSTLAAHRAMSPAENPRAKSCRALRQFSAGLPRCPLVVCGLQWLFGEAITNQPGACNSPGKSGFCPALSGWAGASALVPVGLSQQIWGCPELCKAVQEKILPKCLLWGELPLLLAAGVASLVFTVLEILGWMENRGRESSRKYFTHTKRRRSCLSSRVVRCLDLPSALPKMGVRNQPRKELSFKGFTHCAWQNQRAGIATKCRPYHTGTHTQWAEFSQWEILYFYKSLGEKKKGRLNMIFSMQRRIYLNSDLVEWIKKRTPCSEQAAQHNAARCLQRRGGCHLRLQYLH